MALRVWVPTAPFEPGDAAILSLDLDLEPTDHFKQFADLLVKVLVLEARHVKIEGR